MKKQNDIRLIKAIGIILILLLLLGAFFCLRSESETTSSGVIWNETESYESKNETCSISIHGFTSLNFSADSTAQTVSIYNPENNSCFMNIQILIDDEVIWECENLQPGYGFYEIELNETLGSGTYAAVYKVRCFDLESGSEQNGCTLNFVLYVN